MMVLTFTYSLGPTKASAAGPILTSGSCFSFPRLRYACYHRGLLLILRSVLGSATYAVMKVAALRLLLTCKTTT